MSGARSTRAGWLGAALTASVTALALVATGAQAAPKKKAKAAVVTPAYCSATHIGNLSPDPLLGSGSNKVLENNLTITPGAAGVLGVPANSGTTGSVLKPSTGNQFQVAYLEETEVYEFLNNAGTASKPLSPGASDSGKAILKDLPSGIVNHFNPATPQSTGKGLPYAVILSSDLKTVIAQVPVNIVDQNYTPNPTAWLHATTGSLAQPKPTTCGGGDSLYSLLRFSAQGVAGLTPGVTYAALIRVRDTDTSGPLSNHLWYFTPPPKANPTITTTASPSSATIGDPVADTASVTGGNSPTGKVRFDLYGPDTGAAADCSGTAVATSTVDLVSGAATSSSASPSAPGTYHWRATYLGDTNNNAAGPTACDDSAEQVVINKAQPSISTHASPTSVTLGGSLSDTATVTGGQSPTGTVTFTLYGPNDTTCTGTPVSGTPATVGLDAATGKATSPSITPTQTGIYRWQATYDGDGSNAAAGPNACSDPDENAAVTSPPPPAVKVFVAYADIARNSQSAPPPSGQPSPWQGSANTTFVGCASPLISPPFSNAPCPTTSIGGKVIIRYDAGAIRFDVPAGGPAETFSNASVEIGPTCTGAKAYQPWPGLNVTIQPGKSLILTQTSGNAGSTCTDDPNFDTSESSVHGVCTNNGAMGLIHVTINGVATTFTDKGQILNTGGFDVFDCKGTSEFQNWVALN